MTKTVSVFEARKSGVCNFCGRIVRPGDLINLMGQSLSCEVCTMNHAVAKGYQVVNTTGVKPVKTPKPEVKVVESGVGNGQYISRKAYEQHVFQLTEMLKARFAGIDGKLQKLEAENKVLRDNLEAALQLLGEAQAKPEAQAEGFKCETCGQTFKSGQALGGHSKSHSAKAEEAPVNQPNF